MGYEFDDKYNSNNTYNKSVTPNPYDNRYGNNNAPNPYDSRYGNTAPNRYDNRYGNNIPNPYANNRMSNQYNADTSQWETPKKSKKTRVVVALIIILPIIAFLGFFGLIFGIVSGTLNHVKESEEYALAYSYLVESETFKGLDAEESDVKFTGYSFVTNHNSANSHANKEAFKFRVNGRTLLVVCHKDASEESFVCVECTKFN